MWGAGVPALGHHQRAARHDCAPPPPSLRHRRHLHAPPPNSSPAEGAAFEADAFSPTILKMRTWDEAAKVKGLAVPSLEKYVGTMTALVEAELQRRDQEAASAAV